jgi:predicted transcriptional regulator of viral defense system
MKLVEAQAKLLLLKQSIISTADAAVCLKVTRAHASKLLERLAKAGIVISLARGLWSLAKTVDPLELPEYLTAPFPSYISLQTALYYHGMVSQIPSVTYTVSLARTRRYSTPYGVISIHHIDASFFSDYTVVGDAHSHIKMATPEKALLDVFYLTPAKSNLFKLLPELELPKNFNVKKAYQIIRKIKSTKRRTIVKKKFEDIVLKH